MNQSDYKRQQKRFEILDNIGIQIWKEYDPLFYPIKLNALCWVLLHGNIKDENMDEKEAGIKAEGGEAAKILTGMLKVLDIPADSYCISPIPDTFLNEDAGIAVYSSILRWYPRTVLVLGKSLGNGILEAAKKNGEPLPFAFKMTYHPNELLAEPQKKKEAYQVLLELKEIVHKG